MGSGDKVPNTKYSLSKRHWHQAVGLRREKVSYVLTAVMCEKQVSAEWPSTRTLLISLKHRQAFVGPVGHI